MTQQAPFLTKHPPAWQRLAVSTAVGIGVGLVIGLVSRWDLGLLCGWIATSFTFLTLTFVAVRHLDADATKRLAFREDPSRGMSDILLTIASVGSLGSVGLVISGIDVVGSSASNIRLGLSVLSVMASWTVTHTLFALEYARLYYADGAEGGIDFNNGAPPNYLDFAYIAFTVGMSFAISDTDVSSSSIRRAVLKQALLSYLFGAVIIGATINLVAGLAH